MILILFLTVCLMITLPPQLSDLVGGTAWALLVPGLQRALGDQDPQVGRDRGILFYLHHRKHVFAAFESYLFAFLNSQVASLSLAVHARLLVSGSHLAVRI